MLKKISLIVGTRPNYIKAFPVYGSLVNLKLNVQIVHTGQHYDPIVNEIFFTELEMTKPHVQFILESSGECDQLIEIMKKLSDLYKKNKPDLVIVFGDVTSTLAGSLVANKMKIKLAHVESGLRSFDQTMPEEINRILVDSISDYLFVTEKSGLDNLSHVKKEGVYFVGNTMIDTLVKFNSKIEISECTDYIVLTIHRQSNVDNPLMLTKIVTTLNTIAGKGFKFIFPIHHRTKQKMTNLNLKFNENIKQMAPLGYLDFMKYVKKSSLVVTDSGGIQEETTYLGIHCITLRDNTERPSTLVENGGTNVLSTIEGLERNIDKFCGKRKDTNIELWDGFASDRIASTLASFN